MGNSRYAGKELDLFGTATNWKNYYGSFIKPHLKGKVLEVGAGIGKTSLLLCDGSQDKWVCLEPDPHMAIKIKNMIKTGELPGCCELITGNIKTLPQGELFNTIIYIDVIEHIEEDVKEVEFAVKHLVKGGVLIIMSPAHQGLYTEFDKSVGHYRRYNKKMLKSIIPENLKEKKLIYLDSVGILASIGNKLFLKQPCPDYRQIFLWDKIMIRISRITDFLTFYNLGKSILGVWEKIYDKS